MRWGTWGEGSGGEQAVPSARVMSSTGTSTGAGRTLASAFARRTRAVPATSAVSLSLPLSRSTATARTRAEAGAGRPAAAAHAATRLWTCGRAQIRATACAERHQLGHRGGVTRGATHLVLDCLTVCAKRQQEQHEVHAAPNRRSDLRRLRLECPEHCVKHTQPRRTSVTHVRMPYAFQIEACSQRTAWLRPGSPAWPATGSSERRRRARQR